MVTALFLHHQIMKTGNLLSSEDAGTVHGIREGGTSGRVAAHPMLRSSLTPGKSPGQIRVQVFFP